MNIGAERSVILDQTYFREMLKEQVAKQFQYQNQNDLKKGIHPKKSHLKPRSMSDKTRQMHTAVKAKNTERKDSATSVGTSISR
ncbi:MAG: hypothetical protein H7222_10710 [Methylotenera sp.]|nr:hypothetical protein [Oligoflexia bacterium]